jgi:hypothetical protein
MALPEHSFHAKEINSNEKSVPIPLLNEEKQNWLVEAKLPAQMRKILHQLSCRVKFSMALLEHSLTCWTAF